MSQLESWSDRLNATVHDAAFGQLASEFHCEGFPGMARAAFEALHVNPIYLAERQPNFLRMREALRTESGLVIANHPGVVDIPAVFQGLDRSDVRILASEENAYQAQRMLGSDCFLPVSRDISKLRAVMEEAQSVMHDGGAVFLFPSGGADAHGKELSFQSGFRYLLRGLHPEQMVYSFYIYPDDVRRMIPRLSRAKLQAEMIARRVGIPRVLSTEKQSIRIDEAYSRAGEWQAAIRGIEPRKANQVLTERFVRMFEGEKRYIQ